LARQAFSPTRWSIVFSLWLGILATAYAGDRALFDAIGFSDDGRFFAFEEFGVQDGSGFPYSNIYIVDLERDAWIPGTPIRQRLDDESIDIADARTAAHDQAEPLLERVGIERPAELIYVLGDGVAGDNGKYAVVGVPHYNAGEAIDVHSLVIETFESTSPLTCEDWFGQAPLGMTLVIADSEAVETEIMRDAGTLPESRGCPLDYRLYGVFLPKDSQAFREGVVIVSVYPGGFEGPDRRFIAIPLR